MKLPKMKMKSSPVFVTGGPDLNVLGNRSAARARLGRSVSSGVKSSGMQKITKRANRTGGSRTTGKI